MDEHQIKPIIAIRNCWKDGDAEDNGVRTKLVNGQENVIYTYDGQVSCVCPLSGEVHSMTYGGFERDRETLKYRCPARYSGITCQGMEQCPLAGKAVRIPLAEDRRVFTPVARSSYVWQDYYDERSAVERVNSRLAGGFGFRATGHPRAGEDAVAHHHGADDHAGDGLGADPGRPTRAPAESGQTRRLSGASAPVTKREVPIPPAAQRPRSVLSWPPSHDEARFKRSGILPHTPDGHCFGATVCAQRPRPTLLAPTFVQRPKTLYSAIASAW